MERLWQELRQTIVQAFRNGLISLASLITMTMALLSIALVVVLNIAGSHLKENVYSKLDISVALHDAVSLERVNTFINAVRNHPDVDDNGVRFTSKDKALERFKDFYRDSDELLSFLDTLENPLYGYITIRAEDPLEYGAIREFVMSEKYSDVVSTIQENDRYEQTITRVAQALSIMNRIGITVSVIFILVAIASVYNTTRLAIYSRRQEVDIMKLVGASYSTIRRPFINEGILYGVIGTVVTLILIFPISSFAAPGLLDYLQTTPAQVFAFILTNIPTLILVELIAGVGLGAISSFFATYAYLSENKA